MSLPFFTVGHSTRSIEEFIDVLRASEIELVVDVRRLPGSRRHPQFDEDVLGESLESTGVTAGSSPTISSPMESRCFT